MGNAQDSYVSTALHETIHLAASGGTYSDLDLADAAASLGGLSEKEQYDYDHLDRTDPFKASEFWDHF